MRSRLLGLLRFDSLRLMRTPLGASGLDLGDDLILAHRLHARSLQPLGHLQQPLAGFAPHRFFQQSLDPAVGEQPRALGALGQLVGQLDHQFRRCRCSLRVCACVCIRRAPSLAWLRT